MRPCWGRCWGCASPRAQASRAGTRARSPRSSSRTRARTCCTCWSSRRSCSAGWRHWGAWSGPARSASRCSARATSATCRPSSPSCPACAASASSPRASRASSWPGASSTAATQRPACAGRARRPRAGRDRQAQADQRASCERDPRRRPERLRRRAEEVLDAVRAAASARLSRCRRPPATASPHHEDAPLVALSEALVRARAREADLAYELLAARADLQAIVVAGAHGRGGRRAHAAGLAARAGGRRSCWSCCTDECRCRCAATPQVSLRIYSNVVVDREQRHVHRDHDEAHDRRRSR